MAADFSQIQENLSRVLESALDSTLKEASPGSSWSFKRETGVNEFAKSHCIVLTISSFRFRVMTILHLNFDDRTRKFLADLLNAKQQDVDDDKLIDRLLEISNSFCGHLKRLLQETCPALGMSTPNLLDSACLSLEDIIDIAHEAHTNASEYAGAEPLFGASALVSLLDEADFKVNQPSRTSDAGGELENFGELELF